ncbi:helix-turn-helix domain-containing protein [Staphylococcus hominis]|uniref:helix-turn-helix domain-containing protein n=1 Tax=Staphylococcus hominis TaxID=1290 RepID=UPI001F58C8E7|nr:helix-turn-helix transcriptional regulator [Staphylococcus hominis]MCI2913669.1 helix-turn-helix domain-containing protein [Staphylococcus hominis]
MFDIDNSFARKVRILRAEKRLTLEEASSEIGISSKSLSLIENERKTKLNKTTYQKVIKWLLHY